MITVIFDSKEVKPIKDFPKLMIQPSTGGEVVLFTDYEEGTFIHSSDPKKIGKYFDTFNMENFVDFEGEVKLKNI